MGMDAYAYLIHGFRFTGNVKQMAKAVRGVELTDEHLDANGFYPGEEIEKMAREAGLELVSIGYENDQHYLGAEAVYTSWDGPRPVAALPAMTAEQREKCATLHAALTAAAPDEVGPVGVWLIADHR